MFQSIESVLTHSKYVPKDIYIVTEFLERQINNWTCSQPLNNLNSGKMASVNFTRLKKFSSDAINSTKSSKTTLKYLKQTLYASKSS